VRRIAAFVLVGLTLLAAPLPAAVAQEPPPRDPRELWRQFPLDSQPSNQQAPAERPSTPPASATIGTVDEARDGSRRTVQLAAIVLVLALVLLATTGVLASQLVDAPRATGIVRRQVGNANASLRRAIHAAAAILRARTVAGDTESMRSEGGVVQRSLDAYFASGKGDSAADDDLRSLKAKSSVHPGSTRSLADDELEVLKAKLGKRTAPNVERPHEVEALKAKLAGGTMATEGEPTREELKTR
jgi:hypothetical protein